MNELIGKKVVIHSAGSSGERQDIGTLESVDGTWLKLLKNTNETLYFTVYSIRMVKVFE
ncbi:MAG TPA: hypothetical protein VG944_08355 [Fimbriimonas sp.]|nr:hypothetical protein [Fimbriimonas sp.]